MKGIVVLNKPKGITSSTAVVKVRKALGTRDVGHMGTLDPAGEGVLILGVGKATRLFDYFLTKDKIYEAEFCFGYETNTLDGDGVITTRTETIPTQSDIERSLKNFIGVLQQLPPKYSAKNVNGQRAYDLARQGVEFDLDTKEITVYDFALIEKTLENTYKMKIHCSSGTYIRSLCRDLAYNLNSLATMVSIKRVKSGKYTIENSVTIEQLQEKGADCLISVEQALTDLPVINLGEEYYNNLCNGVKVKHADFNGFFALYCCNELFGIAQIIEGIIDIKTYLRN